MCPRLRDNRTGITPQKEGLSRSFDQGDGTNQPGLLAKSNVLVHCGSSSTQIRWCINKKDVGVIPHSAGAGTDGSADGGRSRVRVR